MFRSKIDVLMTGAGGQGIVLAGDVLAAAALNDGYDIKKADTLGMAQRGGSVVSHIRLADKVYAPLIKKGAADVLLAFEKLEAARWAPYLHHKGVAVVCDHAIPPLPVSTGVEEYPSDEAILRVLRVAADQVFLVPAMQAAQSLGNLRVVNIFMLGFLAQFLPITDEAWREAISQSVPPKALSLNLLAFSKGQEEANGNRRTR